MSVETELKVEGKEDNGKVITKTTVEETMEVDKFRSSYAQRQGEKKQIEQNLKNIDGVLSTIKNIKQSRNLAEIRKLIDKIIKPDNLLEQKKQLKKNLKQTNQVLDNLRPIFDKLQEESKSKD